MYGPTETTVDCAAFHLTRDYRDDEAIPIGKACRNMQIVLLDKDGKPVPDGEAGEICVRGSGLASGYFGNWEKTTECFIQNPTNPYFRDILYRTGDIAVKKDDGLLYFLSRQDGQIKHMGYRIELGEIETALHSVDGIAAAACLFDRNRDRNCLHLRGEPDAAATRACHAQAGAQVYAAQHLRKAGRTADERQRQDRPCQAEGAIYPCGRLRISHRFPIC